MLISLRRFGVVLVGLLLAVPSLTGCQFFSGAPVNRAWVLREGDRLFLQAPCRTDTFDLADIGRATEEGKDPTTERGWVAELQEGAKALHQIELYSQQIDGYDVTGDDVLPQAGVRYNVIFGWVPGGFGMVDGVLSDIPDGGALWAGGIVSRDDVEKQRKNIVRDLCPQG